MVNEELPRRDPQASGGHNPGRNKHQPCAQEKGARIQGCIERKFVGNAGKQLWLKPVFMGLGMWRALHSLRTELPRGDQQDLGILGRWDSQEIKEMFFMQSWNR